MNSRTERERQPVSAIPTNNEMEQRKAEGWRLVAVEWERNVAEQLSTAEAQAPFGLHVSESKQALEIEPKEWEALVLMMELTVQEGPYWPIAEELNRQGFRTREGRAWTPISVFEMLPRLIELGPKIFSSEIWKRRKLRMQSRR